MTRAECDCVDSSSRLNDRAVIGYILNRARRAASGRRPRAAAFLGVVSFAIAPVSALAQRDSVPSPYDLARRVAGEPVWAPMLRLRTAAADTARYASSADLVRQLLAQAEANFGNYQRALAVWDQGARRSNTDTSAATVTFRKSFSAARRVSALDTLVAIADTARVIMVNERHHAASDRILTLELLSKLWAKGFRYFAAEAFAPDSGLAARGYALDDDSYTSEPVFAEVVREARRLGFTLVAYEANGMQFDQPDSLTSQQRRDYWQAANLAAATTSHHPQAKVLVHVGFSHVRERVTANWHPMAAYFAVRTGINPVTVDQTVLTERSTPLVGHPVQMAMRRGAMPTSNTVFVGDGVVLEAASIGVDLMVARAGGVAVDSRPAYLAMGGRRRPVRVAVPECLPQLCVLTAHLANEPDSAAVLDRVEVMRAGRVTVFLPGAAARLSLYASDGRVLRRWNLTRRQTRRSGQSSR